VKSKLYHLTIVFALSASGFVTAQNHPADSLKRIVRNAQEDTVRVNAYNHLSNLYRENNPDSTLYFGKKAQSLAQKSDYGFGLASSYQNQGNAFIVTGDYKKALSLFVRSQQLFEELLSDDKKNTVVKNALGRAYASSAVVFSEESDYAHSLADYQKALTLFTETSNKPMMSRAYNNIAVVYKSQGNLEKSLDFLQKAFVLQQETGEQSAGVTLLNIGAIHFEQGNSDKAKDFYDKAYSILQESGNQRGFALLYNQLGDYHRKLGNVAKADSEYQTSIKLYESMGNKFGAALAYHNLGLLYREHQQFDKALGFAQRSLEYATSIGALNQQYHTEQLLSGLFEDSRQPEKALEYYKKYVASRDKIINEENTRKFALAEMNFEYQKKEALLREKNKRQTQLIILSALALLLLIGLIVVIYNRRQVKRRLTLQKEVAEYEQKALHLQMNPHFVFNCLGSISSFIVQNGTDSALRYLSKFSKLMRLTLEYSKGSLIPIDKEIESLQNYLELEQLRFHDKFNFEIRSSENVEFNMGLPPLLVQPFVENAILHGMVPKEGHGHIVVDFDVKNGQLLCTIQDDGIGIASSQALKENSMTAHKSMALEITKKRLEIMESKTSKSAQIDIAETNENGMTGTRVTLRLPVQYIS